MPLPSPIGNTPPSTRLRPIFPYARIDSLTPPEQGRRHAGGCIVNLSRLFEPRPRRLRRSAIGDARYVACPMLKGFLRGADDCGTCEYNLGERPRPRGMAQLCGHGVKSRQMPAWLVRSVELWRRLPRPHPAVVARFTWKPREQAQVSSRQARRQERSRRRQDTGGRLARVVRINTRARHATGPTHRGERRAAR